VIRSLIIAAGEVHGAPEGMVTVRALRVATTMLIGVAVSGMLAIWHPFWKKGMWRARISRDILAMPRKEVLLFLFRKTPDDMTTYLKRNHAAGVCLEEGLLCLLIESCRLYRTHTLSGETDA
jgi:hypothetical protein